MVLVGGVGHLKLMISDHLGFHFEFLSHGTHQVSSRAFHIHGQDLPGLEHDLSGYFLSLGKKAEEHQDEGGEQAHGG